jgi:serine/threonine/tyrosine protein kinase RAD53
VGTELGKGSFATVRKAVHKTTGKWYAVKMIAPGKSVGQQQSRNQNLIREISIMEKLDHRNICKLIEVFFQNDNSICTFFVLVSYPLMLTFLSKALCLSTSKVATCWIIS